MNWLNPLRRFLNRTIVPRSLFGRSLLIVVLPVVILQLVITVIFYNRHWDTVTRWLATGVAGEVAFIVDLLEETRDPERRTAIMERARQHTDLRLSLESGGDLDSAIRTAEIDPGLLAHIDNKILEAFEESLDRPFVVDLRTASDTPGRVAVYVQLDDGLLRVLAPKKRLTSTTTWLLAAWMVGASIVLLVIAIYFLRLQIRPIRRLARAADSFGKGRDVGDFQPQGASEIKQAARAFNLMRHRILRFVSQRTDMLAAVSHDMRTPLTRMKLELELVEAKDDPVINGLKADVDEMVQLVEAYLSFARGEGREAVSDVPLGPLFEQMRERVTRAGLEAQLTLTGPLSLRLRPLAFRRCLANLIDNACRYAQWVGISARQRGSNVEIVVEDDGPGIPEGQRETVFQPFVRLDQSRSKSTGGLGLGLTIARDVILGHGGDLTLDQSTRGGLRAVIRLPL